MPRTNDGLIMVPPCPVCWNYRNHAEFERAGNAVICGDCGDMRVLTPAEGQAGRMEADG